MKSLVSILAQCTADSASAPGALDGQLLRRRTISGRQGENNLDDLLLAFFRKRLRADPDRDPRPGLPRLLVRRTLDRVARWHAADEASGSEAPSGRSRPRKAVVLRAALMELQHAEPPPFFPPNDRSPADRQH